jgi:hypothetical protein
MQQHESAEETTAGNYNTQKSMCVEEEEEDTPGSRKSQKHKLNLKLKVLKSSAVFLRFSIAKFDQNLRNFKKFLYMVQVGSQKINRRNFFKKHFSIYLVAKFG